MNHFSTLNHYVSDFNQPEEKVDNQEQQLTLGPNSSKKQEPSVFSNLDIDFLDFEDTNISYFGV